MSISTRKDSKVIAMQRKRQLQSTTQADSKDALWTQSPLQRSIYCGSSLGSFWYFISRKGTVVDMQEPLVDW